MTQKKDLWNKLATHATKLKSIRIESLFKDNPNRFNQFNFHYENLFFDFSKNFLTAETINLFIELAEAYNLKNEIVNLCKAKSLNSKLDAVSFHPLLRYQGDEKIILAGNPISDNIKMELERIKIFVEQILEGKWKGFTNKPITDVINIGIGGSDLGVSFLTEALSAYRTPLHIHFVSNGDGIDAYELTKILNPETTLFVIVSKTFSTQETLINANTLVNWFVNSTGHSPFPKHILGISANQKAMHLFGIPSENQFYFWDFIGGRFSIWSAVGMVAALAIGFNNFNDFLIGGYQADKHFINTEFSKNIPFILALLDIFYIHYWSAQTRAILPYHSYLKKLPAYLQQLSMESLGKSLNREAEEIDYPTGNIIWGELGSNGQHAFYQLFHQGKIFIPIDFFVPLKLEHNIEEHSNFILANALAQADALMKGNKKCSILNRVLNNLPTEDFFSPYKLYPGNKPSTMILLSNLSPKTLGNLLAIYEHKIFVQSVLWNINPFDQWGVELGKNLAKEYLKLLKNIHSNPQVCSVTFIKEIKAKEPSLELDF